MAILVLGGAGYIGSHTVYELIDKGEEVVIGDGKLQKLCSCEFFTMTSLKLNGKYEYHLRQYQIITSGILITKIRMQVP